MAKLEDLFFHVQDRENLKQMQALKKLEETKASLRSVSGIHDEAILQKLIDLNIRPETLASLSLVPCVFVAWADGKVTPEEKDAVLAAVVKLGWVQDSPDYSLLEHWMKRKPSADLFEAWTHYIESTCKKMNPDEIARFQQELMAPAKLVGESSGGFLGLRKLSAPEKEMLRKLEQAFGVCRP
jgi:hypothetical protein